jgi:hypothetical protein
MPTRHLPGRREVSEEFCEWGGLSTRPDFLLLVGRASVPAFKRAAWEGRPIGELVAQAFQPVQAQAKACGYIF